jgi:tRNA U34 2-thiouridine synthase MnmA/TrmU
MNIASLISGGVDSSVVVHLLKEAGHHPTLFYIKIGMDDDEYAIIACKFNIAVVVHLRPSPYPFLHQDRDGR